MSRALVLLAGLAVAGCASHAAVNGPPFRLTTSLDREVYKTGDPVTVTVAIENTGTDAIDVPRFDKSSARFMIGEKGLNVRIHREPVHSRAVRSNPRRIEPGASTSRRFVFVNVTQAAGEFALLGTFKGAVADGALIADAVHALPTPFRVTKDVAFERDPANGMILKRQAIEIAKRSVTGNVTRAKAVLVPLGKTGLHTWVVMLRTQNGDGRARQHTVQVDPYVGRVRPVEKKNMNQVAASTGT